MLNCLWEAAQDKHLMPQLVVVWAWGPGCLSLLSQHSSQKPGFVSGFGEGAALKLSTSNYKGGLHAFLSLQPFKTDTSRVHRFP